MIKKTSLCNNRDRDRAITKKDISPFAACIRARRFLFFFFRYVAIIYARVSPTTIESSPIATMRADRTVKIKWRRCITSDWPWTRPVVSLQKSHTSFPESIRKRGSTHGKREEDRRCTWMRALCFVPRLRVYGLWRARRTSAGRFDRINEVHTRANYYPFTSTTTIRCFRCVFVMRPYILSGHQSAAIFTCSENMRV